MIYKIKILLITVITSFLIHSYSVIETKTNIKCMIQMTNYDGFGAYIIISLINPDFG